MAEIAERFMSRNDVKALSVAIARHGQFVYRKAFGVADESSDEAATPSHLFRIASVSKPITAVAIFSLIEKGRLRLSDSVFGSNGVLGFDYGSKYRNRVQKITLENLLTHTSGGWENNNDDPIYLNPGFDQHQLIAWTLQNVPLKYDPGTHFLYSNFGYCILGRVIEKISGRAYEPYVQAEILKKCGVDGMKIGGSGPSQRAQNEVVYYDFAQNNPYAFDVNRLDSAGGWIATASDLVQFAMHVDGFSYTSNILSRQSIEVMTTPCSVTSSPHYAKGWYVNAVPDWWHPGGLPGSSAILVRTETGMCWAALTNTAAAGLAALMREIAMAVPEWHAGLRSF
jgi:CubicO group peptidase (beta-lactamase class C family)